MATEPHRRFAAVIAAVLSMAAACGGSSAVEPAATPVEVLLGELADEPDFETADLYMLHMQRNWTLHRLDPTRAETVPVSRNDPETGLAWLQASPGHDELFVQTFDPDRPDAPPLLSVVRTVDTGAEAALVIGDALIDPANIICVVEAGAQHGGVGISIADDDEWPNPYTAQERVVDRNGVITDTNRLPAHRFCPTRASHTDAWAWSEPETDDDNGEASMVVEVDGTRNRVHWPGCLLHPHEFTADGSRLAFGVSCSEPERNGLWILDVATLEPETPTPLHAGRFGPARWSPSERLIAASFQPNTDAAGNQGLDQITVRIIRLHDGAVAEVPLPGSSWPAWLMHEGSHTPRSGDTATS